MPYKAKIRLQLKSATTIDHPRCLIELQPPPLHDHTTPRGESDGCMEKQPNPKGWEYSSLCSQDPENKVSQALIVFSRCLTPGRMETIANGFEIRSTHDPLAA